MNLKKKNKLMSLKITRTTAFMQNCPYTCGETDKYKQSKHVLK